MARVAVDRAAEPTAERSPRSGAPAGGTESAPSAPIASTAAPVSTTALDRLRRAMRRMSGGSWCAIENWLARCWSSSRISGSDTFIIDHLLSESPQATRHRGLDRPDGTAEDTGGFPLRQILVEAQDDGGALAVRKLLQGAP